MFFNEWSLQQKLKDLWTHRGKKDYEFADIILLKVGRHIRPHADFKLIIGRDEGENYFLESYQQHYTSLKPISHVGPFTLLDGKINAKYIHYAAKIAARFTDANANDKVTLEIHSLSGSVQTVHVSPFTADQILKEWYISG